MRLLVLRHVDDDGVALAAVERVGERHRRLGFTHAARPGEHEHPDRARRVVELRARRADAPRDRLERVALADHALAENLAEPHDGADLVGDHLADRDAGPARDHLGHRLSIDVGEDERELTLKGHQLRALGIVLGAQLLASRIRERRGGLATAFELRAQPVDLGDERLLVHPTRFESRERRPRLLALVARGVELLRVVRAHRHLAHQDPFLAVEGVDAAAKVLDRSGNCLLADRDARAGCVEHAHALVGQLARGDVAARESHRLHDGFVEDAHAVVSLQHAGESAHHLDRGLDRRLLDLDRLEAARQRGVFLEVLLVLGPGRRRDRAQLTASERGLQQVRRVVLALGAAGADHRVRLVDEQDDRRGRPAHLRDHLLQAILELAFHARTGLQETHVEAAQRHVQERLGHVPRGDAQREAFDDGRLADARFTGEDRIVLPPPRQDVDDLADLGIAAEHGIDLARARRGGEVDGELIERR